MRILSAILTVGLALLLHLNSNAQLAGTLDASFGDGGVVTTDVFPELAHAFLPSIHVQTDGKIIAPGYYGTYGSEPSYLGIAVSRYNLNGSLDTGYGQDGISRIPNNELGTNPTNPFLRSSVLTATNELICVGRFTSASGSGLLVVKFKSNGELDSTFGTNGVATEQLDLTSYDSQKVVLLSDGKLLIGGNHLGASPGFVLRLHANGELDQSFGTDGIVIVNQEISNMGIDLFGRIVCSGMYWPDNQPGYMIGVTRLLTDGSFDLNFGVNGTASFDLSETSNPEDRPSRIRALYVYLNGNMLIGGGWYNTIEESIDYFMIKVKKTGHLDSAFADNGVLKFNSNEDYAAVHAALVQPDGQIIGIGESLNSGNPVFRLNDSGSFDNSFGTNGIFSFHFREITADQTTSGAMQLDNKLLVGGITRNPEQGYETEFAIARILTDLNIGIVEFSESLSNTLLYPNPIAEQATFEYELKEAETLTISLMDMSGKRVETFLSEQKQQAGKHQLQLIFSERIESGTYLLSISSEKGQTGIRVIKH